MTPWLLVWAMVCLPATSRNPVRVISRAKVLTSARRGSGSVEGVGAKTLRRDVLRSVPVLVLGSIHLPVQADEAKKPPEVESSSSAEALQLGRELRELGAVFFGAYWCSHCANQKRALGKEAFQMIRYVECAKDGFNSNRKLCNEKDISGYPTWEIAGDLYPGEMSLDELRDIVAEVKKVKGGVSEGESEHEGIVTQTTALTKDAWTINLLYDGDCPVCHAEADFLRTHDPEGKILLTDISSGSYDPSKPENGGVAYKDAMERIHAVTRNGEILQGVQVFRRTYAEIGLGWLFALSSLPAIGPVTDALYDLWAANRLRLTGRGDLATEMVKRRESRRTTCDESTHRCPSLV
ncbi:hypothetical protein AAMO2058_000608200 [Amorphochlora amoebiformis]